MDPNLLAWNILFSKWNPLVYERVKKCLHCCGIRNLRILIHVFNSFKAIRAGSTFWGIWVEAITRIFLVEHLSQSLERERERERDSSLIDRGISNSTNSYPNHECLESILCKGTLFLLIRIQGWYKIGLFQTSYP